MKFVETPLKGAFIVICEPLWDDRGFFMRTFSMKEFEERGLECPTSQSSISFNGKKGTLRGMHFQSNEFSETKLVRCGVGCIYDVIVDLRTESETFLRWFATDLSPANHRSLYIPRGFAHGFQTLEQDTEVHYQISPVFNSEKSAGFRWNDETVGITWPLEVSVLSERDQNLPGVMKALAGAQ